MLSTNFYNKKTIVDFDGIISHSKFLIYAAPKFFELREPGSTHPDLKMLLKI